MRLFSITSKMPDGTAILKFENGFSFEGFLDKKNDPLSGTLTTPEGIKYDIPTFDEDVYAVISLIEKGKLEKFRI